MKKENPNDRFLIKKAEGSPFGTMCEVIVDKETGVNYLFAKAGYGGGLSVMLDKDGKPIVTPVIR